MKISARKFTKGFFHASIGWLSDPEIKKFMNVPDSSSEDQMAWFKTLSSKKDYFIWGIGIDNQKVGAFGLKNIINKQAEFWGYIGERKYWGKGIGNWMLQTAQAKAEELKIDEIHLKVLTDNYKAINLYFKHGFRISGLNASNHFIMTKRLIYILMMLTVKMTLLSLIIQHILYA